MNHQPPAQKVDWKKVGIVLLVLAIAGYRWYSRNQNQAPKPIDTAPPIATQTQQEDAGRWKATLPNQTDRQSATNANQSTEKNKEDYLQPESGKNLKSPAGLIYTAGRSEHRADHVLRHAEDKPNRPTHGVFDVGGDKLFRLIDEAYQLVKTRSKRVTTKKGDDGRTEHVIDMKRKIGYRGGKRGKRENYPSLYKIKLILADNRVITAYPY